MAIRSANREAARLTEAISIADLLDAAAISPSLTQHMIHASGRMLADAARVTAPNPETCRLVISMLQARLTARRQLSRPRVSTMRHGGELCKVGTDNSDESVTRRSTTWHGSR